jgi:hypothetical protein
LGSAERGVDSAAVANLTRARESEGSSGIRRR